MQALDHDAYLKLSADADVLEADQHGAKVLRLTDGSFIKLFRRKRLLSSAMFYPYAQRFADNALAIQRHGIPSPRVLGVYRVTGLDRDAVHYQPLPGKTLRELYRSHAEIANQEIKERLGGFVADLHNQGVYFRSLHLGNIVLTPDNTLGLIDIADMKNQNGPLSRHKRIRNFRHMLRYPEDRNWLFEETNAAFLAAYITGNPQFTGDSRFLSQLKSLESPSS